VVLHTLPPPSALSSSLFFLAEVLTANEDGSPTLLPLPKGKLTR
jgi:hypothetical protein